jgi:uncharacterized protein (TIGR02996 family)
MTNYDAFLREILAHPDDDAPRLIYADWLEKQGDNPRSKLIRVQCELASIPAFDPGRSKLEAIERQLLEHHGQRWLPEWNAEGVKWRLSRGFLEVEVNARAFLACATAILQEGPPTHVRFIWPQGGVSELAASRALAKIHSLSIGTAGMAEVLLASPQLHCLASLDLSFLRVNSDILQAVAQSPYLTQLGSLKLQANKSIAMRSPTATVLGASHHLRALTALDLQGQLIGDAGLDALIDANFWPRLTKINLSDNGISSRGARLLARSAYWGKLSSLGLSNNTLSADDVRAMVLDAVPARLSALHLAGCGIGDYGAWLVAESPGLARLVTLDLSDNCISNDGARALVASPYLPCLQTLILKQNSISESTRNTLQDRFRHCLV